IGDDDLKRVLAGSEGRDLKPASGGEGPAPDLRDVGYRRALSSVDRHAVAIDRDPAFEMRAAVSVELRVVHRIAGVQKHPAPQPSTRHARIRILSLDRSFSFR